MDFNVIKYVLGFGYPWGPPLALALGLVYLLWKVANQRWNQGFRGWRLALDRWMLLSVIGGGFLVAALATYYVKCWGLPERFTVNEVGILIAEIPGDTDRAKQQSYTQAIRALVSQSPDLADSVRVRLIERPLDSDPDPQQHEALSLGRSLHAALVLRAFRVEGGYEAWITVVDQPEFRKDEAHLARVGEAQMVELNTLPLPRDVAALARCALALSFYRRALYTRTISSLDEVFKGGLPDASPPRPYLNLLLGNSHINARFDDPTLHIPLAVKAYEATLAEWTPQSHASEWAGAMNNLGVAYQLLAGPDKDVHLRESIRCFDLSLKVGTRDRDPLNWARTTANRGEAYRDLRGPNRQSNLAEAIHSDDLALEVFQRDKSPLDWAATMSNRGAAYKELAKPDKASNLREAIRSEDLALQIFSEREYPYNWALTTNNRGTAIRELHELDPQVDLKEALRAFDSALEIFVRERYPFQWAMAANNRGIVLAQMVGPNQNRVEEAIQCFDQALQVRTRDQYPIEWSESMITRSMAYLLLGVRGNTAALREAVRSATLALEVTSRETDYMNSIRALKVRGDALSALAGSDNPTDLRKAIESYDEAEKYEARQVAPLMWADMMYNSANAFLVMPGPHRDSNFKQAIRRYDSALEVYTLKDYPEYWARAMYNRGVALVLLSGNRREDLSEAINSFDLVLKVRSPGTARWASALRYKGIAFMYLPDDRLSNLASAIKCFESILATPQDKTNPWPWEGVMQLRDRARKELLERSRRKAPSVSVTSLNKTVRSRPGTLAPLAMSGVPQAAETVG